MTVRRVVVSLSIGAALVCGGAAAMPAAAEDFYKGKQIHLIVPTPTGGSYDAYARAIALSLPNYLPGRPTIVVENMPGASGLKAANYIYNTAPRDGLVIGAGYGGLPTAPLLSPDGAQFDVTKFSWIGSITKEPYIGIVWHTSSIRSLDDARTKPLIVGGSAVGAAGTDYPIIAKALFGFNLKVVTGYANSPDIKLAMERGELDGVFATAWGALNTSEPTWLKEGKVRIVVQHGLARHPEMPNVPLLIEQAKTDADRQVLELLMARQETSKPYFAPPEIPADRLAILRTAFQEALKDREFLSTVQKAHLEIDSPMDGKELAAFTAKLAHTPISVVNRIETILAGFKDGDKK